MYLWDNSDFKDKSSCAEICSGVDRNRNPVFFRQFLSRGDDESLGGARQPDMNVGLPPMAVPFEFVGEQRDMLDNLMMLGWKTSLNKNPNALNHQLFWPCVIYALLKSEIK